MAKKSASWGYHKTLLRERATRNVIKEDSFTVILHKKDLGLATTERDNNSAEMKQGAAMNTVVKDYYSALILLKKDHLDWRQSI